jgi:large subunit ribosomal protein L15
VEFQVVNLDRLCRSTRTGRTCTVDDLVARGAVRDGRPVKVLGTGEAGSALNVTAHAFLGVRQGEDRRRGGQHHRAVTAASGHVPPWIGAVPAVGQSLQR